MPNTFISPKTHSSYRYVYLFIDFQAICPSSMADPWQFMIFMADLFQFIIFHFLGFFNSENWYQWQLPIWPTISPFVIDGNPHTAPPIIMLSSSPIMMLFQLYLPIWHQWHREYLLMFSHLALWGGNHPQFLSEILKCLSWQRLSENVCNLLLCLNIF